MRKLSGTISVAFAVMIVLAGLSGCGGSAGRPAPPPHGHAAVSPFDSFRDIPGVTDAEIGAIEALRGEFDCFVYGMTPSTEAFTDTYGNLSGFSALFCEWLTGLFEIPFVPEHISFSEFLEKFTGYEVSFTGDITPTEERRRAFYMTEDIATRSVYQFRIAGSAPLSEIETIRYGFVEGTSTIEDVTSRLADGTFEILLYSDIQEIYQALKQGEIDVFLNESTQELSFDRYGDIYAEAFLPLIFSPVSMATANPRLEPVISVVTKALQNGAEPWLNRLYNQGYEAYRKNRFLLNLTEEEHAYLRGSVSVPLAVQFYNYPIVFYDTHTEKWDGITIDLLDEVGKITGLTFEIVNDRYTEMSELMAMLADGRAHIFSDLIRSKEREPYFIWAENPILADQYALVSKIDCPNVTVTEIPNARIALIQNTAHAEMFRAWFPGAVNTTVYDTVDSGFAALERDEADLVMVSKTKLLLYANYYSFSGYKANYFFNYFYESAFAYNKEQTVLRSIVDKALSVIDVDVTVDQWITKTYDYRVQIMAAQRPWLIGAIVLSLGMLVLILGLFTRSRNAQKRLVKQQAAVETANRAKSSFLANMSHEMRTPMNAIIGMTAIGKNAGDTERKDRALNKIEDAAVHLLNVINDVLDISKIEAHKLELASVEFNFERMLQQVISIITFRVDEKHQRLTTDIDGGIPRVLIGDDHRLSQVILNLLSNAVKFSPEQGEIGLDASLAREDGETCELRIEVTDQGIGLSAEQKNKLFRAFEQADSGISRKFGGTGLGLSISKRIVELMGGDIWVESELGQGARFIFTVRMKRAPETDGARPDGGAVSGGASGTDVFAGKTALLVEDMEINREILTALLEDTGLRIDCAENGLEACEMVAAAPGKYDLIFMDVQMPKMDGLEATRQIRALTARRSGKLPIIAMTAHVFKSDIDECLAAGMDDHIGKPIDMETVLAKLRIYLNR